MSIKKKDLLNNDILNRLNADEINTLLHELPDPDELLRKAGVDQDVYNEILMDAHIMGEVRQMRSALLGYRYEVQPGDDTPAAQKAAELCQQQLTRQPHRTMRWPDLFWSIGKAPLTGRRVHAVSYSLEGGQYHLQEIFSIPTHKYSFNHKGELRLKTIESIQGEEAPEKRFLITRHMADSENPYGVPLLSACFWPWMFKNGGLKFFVKFCERFGLPFPIGKYPKGTQESDINTLLEALQQLLDDRVAAIADDESIALLESKTSGQLPQERLIELCNREMSKALTSQTAASELTSSSGSRAASQTHKQRTAQNDKTDRELVADTMNQWFMWMTEINVGENVPPPIFKYIDQKQVDIAEVNHALASAKLIPLDKEEVYNRLGWTQPADDAETIYLGQQEHAESITPEEDNGKAEFSARKHAPEWDDTDAAISGLIEQIKDSVEQGESLDDVLNAISNLAPEMDIETLEMLATNELEQQFGEGMVEASA